MLNLNFNFYYKNDIFCLTKCEDTILQLYISGETSNGDVKISNFIVSENLSCDCIYEALLELEEHFCKLGTDSHFVISYDIDTNLSIQQLRELGFIDILRKPIPSYCEVSKCAV